MTLAHLTPLPPERTGVADATARLLSAVGRRTPTAAYAKGHPDPVLGIDVRRATRTGLRHARRADAVVAQVGNSAAHAWILNELKRHPAIVELHDVVLHHLIAQMHFYAGDGSEYVAALERDSGFLGATLARASLDKKIPHLWEIAAERFPLTGEAIAYATSVIVHSQFAANWIRARWPETPVDVVPLLPPDVTRSAPERAHGDSPTIGCFGFATPEKRLSSVIDAMAQVRRSHPKAHLLIVGAVQPGLDLEGLGRAAGLGEGLTVVDYAPPERFGALMAGIDIGVNLRWPTMGETSAIAVQMLAAGTPLLVTDGGWYDEIPDAAVVRIPPDETEVPSLATAICELIDSPQQRAEMREAGETWRQEELSPSRIADAHLLATLGRVGRRRHAENLATELGRRMAEISDRDARQSSGVARHIARVGREISTF